jgi:hypothetical protein
MSALVLSCVPLSTRSSGRPSASIAAPANKREGPLTLSGRVTDSVTRQPLANVIVRIRESPPVGTLTNLAGRYRLIVPDSIAQGQALTLVVRLVGYSEAVRTLRGYADSLAVDVALSPPIIILDPTEIASFTDVEVPVAEVPPSRYWHETPDSVRTRRLGELAEARARWAANAPKRYRLTAEIDCFCFARFGGTPTLEFRGDSLVRVTNPAVRTTASRFWKYFAVPRLFAMAEQVIRDPERFVEKIEYDPTYGFPTVIATDTAREPSEGWFGQYVHKFRPLR